MTALARLAVARPRAFLGAWLALTGILALVGLGLEDHLYRSDISIPGTPAARAAQRAGQRWGESYAWVVSRRAPRRALARQAPRLARKLDRRESITVLSPWSPGAGESLRPGPGK